AASARRQAQTGRALIVTMDALLRETKRWSRKCRTVLAGLRGKDREIYEVLVTGTLTGGRQAMSEPTGGPGPAVRWEEALPPSYPVTECRTGPPGGPPGLPLGAPGGKGEWRGRM